MPSDTWWYPALPKQLSDRFAVGWLIWHTIQDYLVIISWSSPGAIQEEIPYWEQIFMKKCRSVRNTVRFTEAIKVHSSWWSLLFWRTWVKKLFLSSVFFQTGLCWPTDTIPLWNWGIANGWCLALQLILSTQRHMKIWINMCNSNIYFRNNYIFVFHVWCMAA